MKTVAVWLGRTVLSHAHTAVDDHCRLVLDQQQLRYPQPTSEARAEVASRDTSRAPALSMSDCILSSNLSTGRSAMHGMSIIIPLYQYLLHI